MKIRERYDGAPKSFRIRADNVPVGGLDISEDLKATFLNKLIEEPNGQISWKCLEDTTLTAQLVHEADMLRLTGNAPFRMVYPCVRCMEDVEFRVEIGFNARLLPRDKDPDQGQLEFEAESFDDMSAHSTEGAGETVASYYDDGIIDLSDMLREQLFLEFPQYPSCSSEEALSPRECDMTVLHTVNAPAATVIEHPFARLKDWKTHSVN